MTDERNRTQPLLPWLRWWAQLLDSRFRIPGTDIRFGIDPLLSLVPGLGDLSSPIFTIALLGQALYQRVPRVVMLRMLANALIDALIGAVPLAGTIGDIFWRANTANLALVEQHAHRGRPPTRGDYLFVLGVTLVFGLMLAIPVFLAVWVALLMWQLL